MVEVAPLVNHPVGRALEQYLLDTYKDDGLRRWPIGSITEVFFHCLGIISFVDDVTKSKRNPGQVDAALDFLLELVKLPAISASQLAIICSYKANVSLVERRRERLRYAALAEMPPAATVDSFQGREADIIVAIMGTTEAVGPGFTTDEHRLNVLLSRQKSGLLILGDINVLGDNKTFIHPETITRPSTIIGLLQRWYISQSVHEVQWPEYQEL
ncbi:hypothetical protein TGAM01_v203539 [Trichoderma gamsii]|uniref:DNA2/NAM7 helicase-like C-terminal domain-containing protein n=1 Tax=Trichoderma gamsii TaxID=398673 RepID=A0A2P4ZU37_9HYPO|nr:hypothetical protein TGAM01_v203539 [Trichoderma gamsii]PON27772.1 hypothetical protein TGAM01_v203539 [Trichoderma gamsii]